MAKQQQQFLYDYRNDHDESGKGLGKIAFILLIFSILLVLLSHFVLIGKKEKFEKEIPVLKENRQTLEKEVEVLNGRVKHSEESYKKVEALVNKYK
jgi:putative stage III sporulation protein AG